MDIIILQLFIGLKPTTIILGVGNKRRGGVGIRHMYPIVYPTPLFILVNIIISKIKNSHIIHCHNIIIITKFQINIFNIEYVITNNHLGVGNRRLSPT